MNIFDKRPLSLILSVVILAFVIFSFTEAYFGKLLILVAVVLLTVLSFIFLKNKRVVKIALVFSLVSFVLSFLYFEFYFKAYNRYTDEACVECEIIRMTNEGNTTELLVSAESINGDFLSDYELIVYLDRSEHYGFSIGSKIKIYGDIESFGESQDFNFESYYFARGISGVISYPEEVYVTDIGDSYPFEYKIYDYRQTISRKIIQNSKNADVGGLMCALLLGDRDYLPEGSNLDFTRIGITHILALSGSHLVILSIGFMKLLMRLGVKKKSAIVAMIIFTLFYMTITGLSASVVRASLMLIISSSMFLLSRTKDSMTSLILSVLIIIIASPYAIYDVALWLSAFATLGIVVMCERYTVRGEKISLRRFIFISFASSFFAIGATLFISTFTFDGTSALAALATFIFNFLTEAFIYLGILLLLFGSFLPICYLTLPLGKLIIFLVKWLASFEAVYVSTTFVPVYITALVFSFLFFLFFVLKIQHKRAFLSLLLTIFVLYYALAGALSYNSENRDQIVYSIHKNEEIILTSSGEVMLIDIGNYNVKTTNSVYSALIDENLTHIDKYVITNYSYKLREAFSKLSDKVLIDEIYIPAPKTPDEENIYFDLEDFANRHGYKLTYYTTDGFITIGDATLAFHLNYTLGKSEKLLFSIHLDEKLYSYVNVGALSGKEKNMANEVLSGSHGVIFGCHDNKCKDFDFNTKFELAEKIVFSSDKLEFSSDMLEYYENKGSKFFVDRYVLYVK